MIPATLRIFVCTEAIDMRQGFDRLAQLVKSKLGEDPQAGSLFVFANRNATRIKAMWFDHTATACSTSVCTAPCSSCPRPEAPCLCSSTRRSWRRCCAALHALRDGKVTAARASLLDR